jgi:hypothetical protein
LRLIFIDQETGSTQNANSKYLQFNSDTASNYSRTKIVGNGSVAYSNSQTNQTNFRIGEGGTSASPIWQYTSIDIFSYAESTYKTFLVNANQQYDGSTPGDVMDAVGLWRNTSAITSITLALFAGTWSVGTTATLYGIKAA